VRSTWSSSARGVGGVFGLFDRLLPLIARDEEVDWIRRRFRAACADLGTETRVEGGRVIVELQR
jgi:hypothetical protein